MYIENYKQVTENEQYQIYVMKKVVDQAFDLALLADMNLYKQNTGHYYVVL